MGKKFGLCVKNTTTETISRHALIEKDIEMLGTRKEKVVLDAKNYDHAGYRYTRKGSHN